MSRYPWRDTSKDIAEQSSSQWETPGGAQVKADKAEENAEQYSDEKLADHVAIGTHPAENIVESPLKRFASDDRMAFWDNKADGTLATQATKGMMSPEDKAKLDKSTNGMTPDTLMLRDAGGRAKVAAPSAANDIARKQEVDEVQGNLNLHTGNADIHTSAAEHAKLAGIQAGAEVNQNAFSQVNDIQASSKSDGLTVKGGIGITVTTNPISKEMQITATGSATPGAHASSHVTGGTDVIPNAVIDGNSGLMSGADAAFVRRDGETKSGSQVKADAARDTAKSYADQQISKITPASIGAETPPGAQAKADEAQQAAEEYSDGKLAAHLADNVSHVHYGPDTGTANAKVVTLSPVPAAYVEGMALAFKNAVLNTGAVTINVNGLGAKTILKSNGSALASGNLKANSIYTVRYNGTNFILQGEGGGGTAAAADLRAGKTASVDLGDIVGSMADITLNGKTTEITDQNGEITIPAGYSDGTGKIKATYAKGIAAYVNTQTVPSSSYYDLITGFQPKVAEVERVGTPSEWAVLINTPVKDYEYHEPSNGGVLFDSFLANGVRYRNAWGVAISLKFYVTAR